MWWRGGVSGAWASRVRHDLRAGWVGPGAAARWARFMSNGIRADGEEAGSALHVAHAAVTDGPSRCPTCAVLDRLLDLGDRDGPIDLRG